MRLRLLSTDSGFQYFLEWVLLCNQGPSLSTCPSHPLVYAAVFYQADAGSYTCGSSKVCSEVP